jgi:hypothetical protein
MISVSLITTLLALCVTQRAGIAGALSRGERALEEGAHIIFCAVLLGTFAASSTALCGVHLILIVHQSTMRVIAGLVFHPLPETIMSPSLHLSEERRSPTQPRVTGEAHTVGQGCRTFLPTQQ